MKLELRRINAAPDSDRVDERGQPLKLELSRTQPTRDWSGHAGSHPCGFLPDPFDGAQGRAVPATRFVLVLVPVMVFVPVIVFLLAQVFSLRRRVRCRGSQIDGWLASRAEEPATTSGRLFA